MRQTNRVGWPTSRPSKLAAAVPRGSALDTGLLEEPQPYMLSDVNELHAHLESLSPGHSAWPATATATARSLLLKDRPAGRAGRSVPPTTA